MGLLLPFASEGEIEGLELVMKLPQMPGKKEILVWQDP
jgi:hypothetical protein